MRPIALVLALAASLNVPAAFAAAPDSRALDRARRAYNAGRYDAAIGAARHALEVPDQADAARLVMARALLERFRTSSLPGDLVEARDTLRAISLPSLARNERYELMVGFGQWLFLTGRFGAAAELFDTALGSTGPAPAGSRDRLLDWWASALDRQVQASGTDAAELYGRVLERMELEARRDPSSAAAAYWVAAAARGLGQLDRAWQAAMAAWVRTGLTQDRAAALRADLDRLVLTAIIPDRARDTGPASSGRREAADTMITDWERFKADWEPSPPAPLSQPQ
jgi:tetratricopeptide (TPR) repeat protein